MSGQPPQASGFCVLDNDFARAQFGRAPMAVLRVTAAHEFFHAIQFAYDFTEDPWLLESTATWMEDQFADGVNDNRAYLRFGQLARPGCPLDLFDPGGYAHYGNWAFWDFLGRRFGTEIVREVGSAPAPAAAFPTTSRPRPCAACWRARGSAAGLRRLRRRQHDPRRHLPRGRGLPPPPSRAPLGPAQGGWWSRAPPGPPHLALGADDARPRRRRGRGWRSASTGPTATGRPPPSCSSSAPTGR